MTKKEANELVLEKWNILRKLDYRKYKELTAHDIIDKVLPKKILKLVASCAWCQLYYLFGYEMCDDKCPLVNINDYCEEFNSTYDKYDVNPSRKTATAMYNKCVEAIKASK